MRKVILMMLCVGALQCCAYASHFLVRPLRADEQQRLIDDQLYRPDCPVPLSRLRVVQVDYFTLQGRPRIGQFVTMDAVAGDAMRVFTHMYSALFRIGEPRISVAPDDPQKADYTIGFNCRPIIGGTVWSLHSYGTALDISTQKDPYLGFFEYQGGRMAAGVIPKVTTLQDFIRKWPPAPCDAYHLDLFVRDFAAHGWTDWGGAWSDPVDYMIVQVPRWVSAMMTVMTPPDAEQFFNIYKKYSQLMDKLTDSSFALLYQLYPRDFFAIFQQNVPRLGYMVQKDFLALLYNDLAQFTAVHPTEPDAPSPSNTGHPVNMVRLFSQEHRD